MKSFDLFSDVIDFSPVKALAWWEKRRIVYNIIMALTGLFVMVMSNSFYISDYTGIILYAVIVNLFYSLGFLTEMGMRHYLKNKIDLTEKRNTLFTFGIILSVALTILIGVLQSFLN